MRIWLLSLALWASVPTIPILLPGGTKITAELARTPEEQARGLMGRLELPKNQGMLFIFPKEQDLVFWMKNTWIDLDIVFMDKDGKIGKIFPRVPRSYPDTRETKIARVHARGQYVLELAAGSALKYHLKAGQRLSFKLPGIR